jgi:hypothetical protein
VQLQHTDAAPSRLHLACRRRGCHTCGSVVAKHECHHRPSIRLQHGREWRDAGMSDHSRATVLASDRQRRAVTAASPVRYACQQVATKAMNDAAALRAPVDVRAAAFSEATCQWRASTAAGTDAMKAGDIDSDAADERRSPYIGGGPRAPFAVAERRDEEGERDGVEESDCGTSNSSSCSINARLVRHTPRHTCFTDLWHRGG